MNLKDKVAIVTGSGGGGSGRAIARRFAREGASVVVSDLDTAGGNETVRLIEAEGGCARFFRADTGVMVWWNGRPPLLIPFGDPGYERLDALT